jgi:hypothetical protein
MKNDIIIGPTVLQSHEVFSKWILNPILTLFDSTYEPPKIKILNWYKNQGDLLNTTDNLLNVQIEINTGNDNVIPINYDLISPREGILIDTKYKVGDYVEFGKAIAVIDFEEKEEMLEDEIEENEIIEEEVDDPNNINYKKIISDIKIEISSRLIDNIEESKKLLLKCETAKSLSEEVYSYFPEDIFEENEDIYNEISGVKDKLFKILIESSFFVNVFFI